jgi:hypothetical protein
MSTPSLRSSQPVNDSNFFAVLMPNQGRTRFLRGVILFFLGVGALGCISIVVSVLSEFHARHTWPVAQVRVSAVDQKSYTGPSIRDHVTHYFAEYEVRFAVPAEQCLTGTTLVNDGEPLSCVGIVRTRKTNSHLTGSVSSEKKGCSRQRDGEGYAKIVPFSVPTYRVTRLVSDAADNSGDVFRPHFLSVAQPKAIQLSLLAEQYRSLNHVRSRDRPWVASRLRSSSCAVTRNRFEPS